SKCPLPENGPLAGGPLNVPLLSGGLTAARRSFSGLVDDGAGHPLGDPALLVHLAGAGDRQVAGGDVAGDGRPGGHVGAVGHGHGRDEGRVAADEGSLTDLGVLLGFTAVVGDDDAAADVGLGPDGGVTDVGQVRDLGARADLGVLGLGERADLGALGELGGGPQVGVRADLGARAEGGLVGVAAHDDGALADEGVGQGGVGADLGARVHRGGALELASGADEHVGGDLDGDV